MNIRILLICVLVVSFSIANSSFAAEQKMLFNVESISYKQDEGKYSCQNACLTKYNDPPLEEMLKQGWRIISSSPKEAIGSEYKSFPPTRYSSGTYYGCTCKGTQYVLQKDDPTPARPAAPSPNEKLLTKENELLKREIALLKKENAHLKEKLNQKQKKKKVTDN